MEDNGHNEEQRSSELRRATLGNAAATDINVAGLVRRSIKVSKDDQRRLGVEVADIAYLGHKLRSE